MLVDRHEDVDLIARRTELVGRTAPKDLAMAGGEAHERISTGVSGLDLLLGGGLVAGGVYLLMGRPGTGKTTLGNQACFTHVATGKRAVYVTLLAETHARMLRNLTSMAFFNADAI